MSNLYAVGDLTGVPLLKFSADSGAKAVQAILQEPEFSAQAHPKEHDYDLVIIGAGVSGISAAIEAKKAGLHTVLYEADESFSTLHNFPRKKPIYTYPSEMRPAGELTFSAAVKEDLIAELQAQQAAHLGEFFAIGCVCLPAGIIHPIAVDIELQQLRVELCAGMGAVQSQQQRGQSPNLDGPQPSHVLCGGAPAAGALTRGAAITVLAQPDGLF